MKVKRGWKKPA